MYRRLCEALGIEALIDDPRFRSSKDRSKNRAVLNAELDRVLSSKTSADWVELLNAKGVPSGPILNVQQVYENEQIVHLNMAVPVKHPALGELRLQAPPSTLSRTPASVRTPAPDVGEHTDESWASSASRPTTSRACAATKSSRRSEASTAPPRPPPPSRTAPATPALNGPSPLVTANPRLLVALAALQFTLFPIPIVTLFWKDQIGLSLADIFVLQAVCSASRWCSSSSPPATSPIASATAGRSSWAPRSGARAG